MPSVCLVRQFASLVVQILSSSACVPVRESVRISSDLFFMYTKSQSG